MGRMSWGKASSTTLTSPPAKPPAKPSAAVPKSEFMDYEPNDHEFIDINDDFYFNASDDNIIDYAVERILADKMIKYKRHYLVQWAPPHQDEESSWEPEDDLLSLTGAREALKLWMPKHGGKLGQKEALGGGGRQVSEQTTSPAAKRPGTHRSQCRGGAPGEESLDKRKLLDEFKKPLDDTYTLIDNFGVKSQVPTVLLVAQVEAMREQLDKLVVRAATLGRRIEGLEGRAKLSSTQQEALVELRHEKRYACQ